MHLSHILVLLHQGRGAPMLPAAADWLQCLQHTHCVSKGLHWEHSCDKSIACLELLVAQMYTILVR